MDGTPDRGSAGRCGAVREDLGVYVLGALEPEENEQISAHLVVCSACRTEYDESAKVAALLAELLPVIRVDGHPGEPWPAQPSQERSPS